MKEEEEPEVVQDRIYHVAEEDESVLSLRSAVSHAFNKGENRGLVLHKDLIQRNENSQHLSVDMSGPAWQR